MIYKDLNLLTPQFRQKVELWLAENPDVKIFETWRSYTRQLWLYAQGRSRPGAKITWTLKSMHQLGKAVDIGQPYPVSENQWRQLADSAKKYGIDWSYDLFKNERAHFQDDNNPLNPTLMPIPQWAEETVNEMKEAGITTDPNSQVGSLPLYHILAVVAKFVKFIIKK